MESTERFPGFAILSELGRGTTGITYEAKDTHLNRRCVIKTTVPVPDADRPARDRQFFFEARALAYLTSFPESSGIPKLHLVAVDNSGQPFYAREFVDGETLEARVAAGSINGFDGLRTIALIAGVVEWIHNQGFVHQNINPSNVLIAHDSTPKLIGFGRAALRTGSLHGNDSSTQVPPEVDIQRLQLLVRWLFTAVNQPVPTELAWITTAGSFATAGEFSRALATCL